MPHQTIAIHAPSEIGTGYSSEGSICAIRKAAHVSAFVESI
ncbi:MAG: hypothetical protein NZM04_05380 [Methylacidiphilales bacterium]|nr:hypothetical protein [Candidatus Methylacidiphilales bacterium]